ncbi:MAG: glycosyltransferase family 39 protein, partial [Polyangiales bacterium]
CMRFVSIVASLGSFALMYGLVARETRDRVAGLAAAGAFAASYMRSAQFLDIARVDALALFFSLAGIYVVRHRASSIAGQLAAAALLGLSFMTKQSMLFVALAMIGWMAWTERKRAVPFAVATLVFTLGVFWAVDWMHDGWLRYYLWELPQAHPKVPTAWTGFWTDDLFPVYGIAGAVGLFYLIAAKDRASALFFLLATGALTCGAWSGRVHDGGWPNVLIPGFASLALLMGLGVGEGFARFSDDARSRVAVLVVAIAQLAVLWFDAKRTLPQKYDRQLGDALIARIRAVDGDVWMPHHAWYPHLAGKRQFAHKMAIDDVLRGDPYGEGVILLTSIRRAIEGKRFGAIISDDEYFENEIGRTYYAGPPPFTTQNGFFAPTGIHIRPRYFFLRR